ncbi:hypothetical protein [Asaia platycodi]|uniref:hypothetical protein n=1 Tax=Asaia platycodi TaxID=610243 RepID=UPI000A63C6CB|nr:hypothetical protein [Asaia platycodi]
MNTTRHNWTLTALSPEVVITCHEPPEVTDTALEQGIEAIWQETRQKHPKLYNGRVFCLSSLSETVLSGFWCEYRWVLAQMRSPELASRLRLRSLAVTALLICLKGSFWVVATPTRSIFRAIGRVSLREASKRGLVTRRLT